MKIREMFSVPEGKRITEKYLYRALALSICSILLCMVCLAGTTWAWFSVSIENTGNVIELATEPKVSITINQTMAKSAKELLPGNNSVVVTHAGKTDDIAQKSTVYVTFLLDQEVLGYVMLNSQNSYSANVFIEIQGSNDKDNQTKRSTLSWVVSWAKPEDLPLLGGALTVTLDEEETKQPEETPEPTQTEPTEEATQPTEAVTDPPEESSEPTETTAPPETDTDASEDGE